MVTHTHCRRVALLIERLALQIGLSTSDSRSIAEAAILHDIGKFTVPMELLQKTTRLSEDDVAAIKLHSQAGHDILRATDDPVIELAADIALYHHERYDGTGYPNGLAGDAIPLPAQITSVCDIYDALREDRPYRPGLTHEVAMSIIVNGDGRTKPAHFAPYVLSAFEKAAADARAIFSGTPGADDRPR